MRDLKNYKSPEPMTRNQLGILSFVAGVMFWMVIEMMAKGIA